MDARWQQVNNNLSEYTTKLGLNIHKSDKIEEILNLNNEQLRNLTADDCGIYSYLLMQYSIFLQKETNRHAAKQRWAQHNLNFLSGKLGQKYGTTYSKFEERQLMLIADNSFAKALSDLIRESGIVIEEFAFIAKKIESMAQVLVDLQRTKRSTYEKSRNS